jgi:two-component system, OmpR family, phosphate regulon sensor histidine kinase PhoR
MKRKIRRPFTVPADTKGDWIGRRSNVRILLSSTRFIASLFWLTIVVATMLFVVPYSGRVQSPAFWAFLFIGIGVFIGHRYFPYEGYHPIWFLLLMIATDSLIALMVYLTGGSQSSLSLLFLVVIVFSSAYFELLETMLLTAATSAIYFIPVLYESMTYETVKNMAIAVPIYFILALCGFFVISKAREQEREKKTLTHLFDEADTKRQELATLYAVSLKFASTLDDEEMLSILIENTSHLVASDAIGIALWDSANRLGLKGSRGFEGGEAEELVLPSEGNPLYVSASAVLPVILRDASEDERFQSFLERIGFTSVIAVPLYASSSVIGVLFCASHEGNAFDDDTARLLLTLASEAALALEKGYLYRTTLEDKTKIEAIINSLSDGLMVIDQDGKLVLANPTISRLLDLKAGAYETRLPQLLENSQYAIEVKDTTYVEILERVLQRGENLKIDVILGTDPPTIFQSFWVPLKDSEGKSSGAVILMHDVTYYVELDRMKSDFISIVSHELKTPLTSITGFVRLLSAERVGPITQKQRHYLDIVQKQSESLTALINDLLDLSRIEEGIIDVRHEPVSLAEVIKGVAQQLDNMAQERNVGLSIDVPPDLPDIKGDSDRLTQVFMNLIHNALKFTQSGGKVRVKAGSLGNECLVRVADTGIGISSKDLPKIFNKFYQVDSSSTRQQSGTGLGLSISKQLIAAHGGDIWVNSTPGKGTTFSLTLPFYGPTQMPGDEGGRLGKAAS